MHTSDWLIVGNGVVGATTACLLADAGFSVTVLDSHPRPLAVDEAWDLKTYSLTPASRRILTAIGVWPRLAPTRIAPYDRMAVWERGQDEGIGFDAAANGRSALGYILEQSRLLLALHGALRGRPAIAVAAGVPAALEPVDGALVVLTADGRRWPARAVAACDGGDSALRVLAGIDCEITDYPQHAVVANVETELPHGAIARQCFLPDGPLAFLPLPPARTCSIVWSTTPAAAAAAVAADDPGFCASLGQAFGHRLGTVRETSRRLALPLVRRHARRYSEGRVVLVGDAAHGVHPLAGQGLNLGLLDAAVLAELAAVAGSRGLIDPMPLFRRYERQRRGEVLAMLTATDRLNRLFLYHSPWASRLRRAGLHVTDRMEPLKRCLMAYAMGDAGDLPRLARP